LNEYASCLYLSYFVKIKNKNIHYLFYKQFSNKLNSSKNAKNGRELRRGKEGGRDRGRDREVDW